MAKTLYWMQGGACGGDSMSLLNTTSPNLTDLLGLLDIEPALASVSVERDRAGPSARDRCDPVG